MLDKLSFSLIAFVAPTGPPVDVKVNALSSSSLEVSWIKPDKSVLHGNLVRYDVEYRRVVCSESNPVSVSDGSWKSIQVANTSVSMQIGSLVFWSCYEVRMRAVTVGDGPYSNITDMRTMEHGELLFLLFFSLLVVLCTFFLD